ncbi:AfsR/SARP family transcriptional regulator [Sphaerisporangium fuscum]|uniref:AfsR/SARP family transcriptional regulator n=1 Tax=Sphaerisporangium fuscum TaxID=2835868 RepID=UPI0020299AC8|nr:winged helix-turn-helix domain-containing protein [Sphaerisporangium fuscum]
MDFRILGALEVWRSGRRIPLTAPKQRALLALLLIRAGQVVPAERLILELWGTDPPRSVESTLHSLISRLRRALPGAGGPALVREDPGYVLRPDGAELDARVFDASPPRRGTWPRGGAWRRRRGGTGRRPACGGGRRCRTCRTPR